MSKMTVGKITFQEALDPIRNSIEKIQLRILAKKLESTYQKLQARMAALEHKIKKLEKKTAKC